MDDRARLTAFLVGASGAWNAGNVGPIADQLSRDLSVSLAAVGLLSGTFFFLGIVAAALTGSELSQRIPVARGLRAACLLGFAGNIVCAFCPVGPYGGLIAGRVVVGLGAGLIFLFGGALARALGGTRLLGVFGAGITLGVAAALGLGGVLEEIGADWRLAFAISALVALAPLRLLPAQLDAGAPRSEPTEGVIREAAGSLGFWRLELLAISVISVPLVLGAWLVGYLGSEHGITPGLAGALSFGLFAVSAATRYAGGRLSAAGGAPGALALGGCAIGAAGIAVLAFSDSPVAAALSLVLIGVGLSLPYALVYDEGERVLSDRPVGGLGLTQVGANAFPIVAIPLVGAALSEGAAETAFLALAAFALIAGLANIRPAAAGP